jgi:type VI secretion system protein ImpK
MDINPYIKLSYPILELVLMKEDDLGSEQITRDEILKRFESFECACLSKDLRVGDSQAVKYALAALVDESFSTSKTDIGEPLQLTFFGEHRAGEGFYNRLAVIRQKGIVHVLEVYYLCLQLGFIGMFIVEGIEKKTALLVDLRAQLDGLQHKKKDSLSVDAYPRKGMFERVSTKVPTWIWASTFIAMAIVSFTIFSILIEIRKSKSINNINQYYKVNVIAKKSKLID